MEYERESETERQADKIVYERRGFASGGRARGRTLTDAKPQRCAHWEVACAYLHDRKGGG